MNEEDQDWVKNNLGETPEETEGDFEGTVFLSTDGKQTVSVKASTKAGRKAALMWAKSVYERLTYSYGSKQAQAVKEYDKLAKEKNGLMCPIDGIPYEQKEGKYGVFYSHYVGKGEDGKPIYHTKKD